MGAEIGEVPCWSHTWPSRFWLLLRFWVGLGFVWGFLWLNTHKSTDYCVSGECHMQKQTGGLCWQCPAQSYRMCFQRHKSLSTRWPPVCAVHHRLSRNYSYTHFLFLQSFMLQGMVRSSRTKRCKIRPGNAGRLSERVLPGLPMMPGQVKSSSLPEQNISLGPTASKDTWRDVQSCCTCTALWEHLPGLKTISFQSSHQWVAERSLRWLPVNVLKQ